MSEKPTSGPVSMKTNHTAAELRALAHVREWVFDLDNTLYPRTSDLFAQIDWKMTDYVAALLETDKETARAEQKRLYREHGTTLRGLMSDHGIDPHDFLAKVHDIDYAPVAPNEALGAMIAALPGRAHIFTNGDVPHARRTTDRLGITEHFETVFDIVAADLEPKPARRPYERFLEASGVDPSRAAMFEDMPRNLSVPHAMGMRTVLVLPTGFEGTDAQRWEHEVERAEEIDFATDHLDDFLADVLAALAD